jgi:hypothetical protein
VLGACGENTSESENVLVLTAQEFDEVLAARVSGLIDVVKPGKYKFKVRVADDQGRCGEARLEVRVLQES